MRILSLFFFVFGLLSPIALAKVDEQLTIPQLHQQMQQGQLTSVELVQFYLDRIALFDRRGPALNSIAQLNSNALQQAKLLDKALNSTGLVGPLHGIPVLLKDNIDTLDGMANTAGSFALENNFPKDDAFFVKELKKAGAIILGKTNLSEWANFRSTAASSGWSGLYGQTKNPYDTTVSPCGSSSGSGVSMAANLATVAVGTETDGSVTCPSAVNGIVGIKPTLGTVSRDGIIPISHSQDTAGPMARNVTDAVILLSAMVAADQTDPNVETSPVDYLSHLTLEGLKGKRIGIARNLMGYHKAVDKRFEQALTVLRAQGAIIVDKTNFDNQTDWSNAEFTVLLHEFKAGLNHYLSQTDAKQPKSLAQLIEFNKRHRDKEMPYFEQELFEMAQEKGDLSSKEYLQAHQLAKSSTQENGIDLLLEKHQLDLIIAPTTGPAWKTDWVNGDHYLGSASSVAAVAGYPHITVPMGYIHGLPVGLSFFSGKLQEGVLIEAAYSYEQATKHRRKPILGENDQ